MQMHHFYLELPRVCTHIKDLHGLVHRQPQLRATQVMPEPGRIRRLAVAICRFAKIEVTVPLSIDDG